MALTSIGFNGTVNDIQWAILSRYLGTEYCADSANGFRVAVASGRSVRALPGAAFGRGVLTTSTADEVVILPTPTPTSNTWYLIVLRRVWATKTTDVRALGHTTTAGSTPSPVPTTYPAGLQTTPGVSDDQILGWVNTNSANTNLVIVDARRLVGQVTPRVSSVDMRTAIYPAPVQGNRVIRTDLNVTEEYFAAWHLTNNPGGAAVAGWYPVEGNTPTALVTKSATQNTSTTPAVVAWNTTAPSDDSWGMFDTAAPGLITCRVAGIYRLTSRLQLNTGGVLLFASVRLNGATVVPTAASIGVAAATGAAGANIVEGFIELAVGDTIEVLASSSAAGVLQTSSWIMLEYIKPRRRV